MKSLILTLAAAITLTSCALRTTPPVSIVKDPLGRGYYLDKWFFGYVKVEKDSTISETRYWNEDLIYPTKEEAVWAKSVYDIWASNK